MKKQDSNREEYYSMKNDTEMDSELVDFMKLAIEQEMKNATNKTVNKMFAPPVPIPTISINKMPINNMGMMFDSMTTTSSSQNLDHDTIKDIMTDHSKLEKLRYQPEELSMMVISKDPSAIRFVRNQTYLICETAIKLDPTVIEYINPDRLTASLIDMAVGLNGEVIEFVDNPTTKQKWTAIMSRSSAIRFIPDHDIDMAQTAFDDLHLNMIYMNPEFVTREHVEQAFRTFPSTIAIIDEFTDDMLDVIMSNHITKVNYITDDDVLLRMIERADGTHLAHYIIHNNPSEVVTKAMINKFPDIVKKILRAVNYVKFSEDFRAEVILRFGDDL